MHGNVEFLLFVIRISIRTTAFVFVVLVVMTKNSRARQSTHQAKSPYTVVATEIAFRVVIVLKAGVPLGGGTSIELVNNRAGTVVHGIGAAALFVSATVLVVSTDVFVMVFFVI